LKDEKHLGLNGSKMIERKFYLFVSAVVFKVIFCK